MGLKAGLSERRSAEWLRDDQPGSDSTASGRVEEPSTASKVVPIEDAAVRRRRSLSYWSNSDSKRLFDVACVVFFLPVVIPLFLLIGLAVRITSRGPVLFRQKRMGRFGRPFVIYKFRTMPIHRDAVDRPEVTTCVNQKFTPVGPFLRRSKLDELPQLLNVLLGDMSLVGPRPKMPGHQTIRLKARPGITGRATFVFAREEMVLADVPCDKLEHYYHSVILPVKQKLDNEYTASATFRSDLKLIVRSVLRDWDETELEQLLGGHPFAPPAYDRAPLRASKLQVEHALKATPQVSIEPEWQPE